MNETKKSFKDYIPEVTPKNQVIIHPLHEDTSDISNDTSEVEFDYQLLEETLKNNITVMLSEEYEQRFNDLKLALHEELMEKTVNHLQENQQMISNVTEALLNMTTKLCEKIDLLQSNLNITVPTPIVQVTLPERNIIKKVHRDNNGNITHVSEETSVNGQNNIGDNE